MLTVGLVRRWTVSEISGGLGPRKMLMICLPGEAACPWMTGCKNATSALKRSLPPISETPLNSGTAGGIAMKTTSSDDCSKKRPLFLDLLPQNTSKRLGKCYDTVQYLQS